MVEAFDPQVRWHGAGDPDSKGASHNRQDTEAFVGGLLADATLIPNVAACYPLSEAGTAVTLAESRTTRGEAILVPWADQRDLPPFLTAT